MHILEPVLLNQLALELNAQHNMHKTGI